ncbi:hypothetical protein AMS68_004113 [Peltaster fructicola]|uniref:Uncharacterized protein n=1 Tax=Peltaster fructicola TaxID=286661 RepID=A0A6H0XV82_9PEZI|nr:hypothetical protein AMS68_004113 [Peltaster fructicola]
MTTGGAGPLVPTFHGFVQNSMDGLILFEACLSGKLHHVPRRPHDRERNSLIKSGSIFIYEENASGIKRWTDGVAWSPSRILGNFLIYRELEKPFPPGEKKRAMKRKRTSLPGEPYPRRDSEQHSEPIEVQRPLTPPTPSVAGEQKPGVPGSDQDKELERQLIGSLVDSYGFRPDGLVKKTMSISINGISHHMVSYYKVDDVKHNNLPRPLSDPRLASVQVRPELYLKQNFRAPVEEGDHFPVDQSTMHMHSQAMYQHMNNGAYNVRPGQYFAGQQQYPMYSMPASGANMYPGATTTAWPATPTSGAMAYGTHPAYAAQAYPGYYKDSAPTPTASVKQEEHSHASTPTMNGYSGGYASQYPNMQRADSQASSGMIHSSYSTPVQPQGQGFGSMSAPSGRSSYSSTGMNGSAQNGQSHHMYSTSQNGQTIPSQGYHVRSPTQGYGMASAPSSATAQSPHHTVKSPVSMTQASQHMNGEQMHNGHLSYSRQNSYGVPQAPQSGHSASDINGLGISGGASYGAGYGAAGQAFRPVAEVGGQSGQHYGQ